MAIDLWEELRDVDDLTTTAAAQLLSLACACEGEDAIAQDLKVTGYGMAQRLGLFNTSAVNDPMASGEFSAPLQRWRAHVAWGVYNWLR